jgi:hypothetical protein
MILMKKQNSFVAGLLSLAAVLSVFGSISPVSAATTNPACLPYNQVIVSNTDDQVVLGEGTSNAVLPTHQGTFWTEISGAEWIWSAEVVSEPQNGEGPIEFIKYFTLPGSVSSASLEVAVDDYFKAFINGAQVASEFGEDNFSNSRMYDVSALLVAGTNSISFEVTNAPYFFPEQGTVENNPAGLSYRLDVAGTACESTPTPTPTSTPTTYRLSVSTSGDGHGSVTAPGIECSTDVMEDDCGEEYPAGSEVEVTATAQEGSNFNSSWSGACTGNNPVCVVVMDGDKNLDGHFALNSSSGSRRGSGRGSQSMSTPTPSVTPDASNGTNGDGEVLGASTQLPETGLNGTEGVLVASFIMIILAGILLAVSGVRLPSLRK